MSSTAVASCSGILQPPHYSNGAALIVVKAGEIPGVDVYLHRWTDNTLQAAITLCHEHEYDRIILFGHSRGGQWAVDVADHCNSFGVTVAKIVLADGWNGRQKKASILIPPNVLEVESWTQDTNRPRGSKILLSHQQTKWIPHKAPAGTKHAQVDELPEVVAAVMAALSP